MKAFTIHTQLLTDCHQLGGMQTGSLLLHRNSNLPWFIVVPHSDLADVLDLPSEQRQKVMEDCASISAFIKKALGFSKVNFAGLGNQVPQMHLHIIGRQVGDVCWPQPVWGQIPPGENYSAEQLQQWQGQLMSGYGLLSAADFT